MKQLLPELPVVDDALLARYYDAHRDLDLRLGAVTEPVFRTWHRCALRLHLDCLARIEPVLTGISRPVLMPRARGFLSAAQRARRDGVAAAWRYADSRLAMHRRGLDSPLIRAETPYVLHALSEGRTDNPDESNPGMARVTENWWVNKRGTWQTAPTDRTREIVDTAVKVATETDAPGAVIGGWLAVIVSSAHPFVDGNGRLLRMLFLLSSGRDLPRTVDWGVAEQMLFYRRRYVEPLEQGHMAGGAPYDGADIDTSPWTNAVLSWSIDGAQLAAERLDAVAAVHALVTRWGITDDDAGLVVTAAWRGVVGPAECAVEPGAPAYPELLAAFERLASGGALQRVPWPGSRRADVTGNAVGPAYRLGGDAHREVTAELLGRQG